jgi:alpha-amylase/alpha-mannosidase (GH57 family)
MADIFHALVLSLHQPSANLQYLLEHNEWEAKEILYAFDRIPRSLWEYDDIARVHLSLSGTLLETLSREDFQNRAYGIVKCGDFLWHLQNTKLFEILGSAYYHPVLPLIPPVDWAEHLQRWLGIGRHVFAKPNFIGFWPPEMGFCMELIPLLSRLGYQYVLVDSEHVEPLTSMSWEELRYRPHVARFGGAEIIVVVRDRDLSNAQQSGIEYEWFVREVYQRTQTCEFPALVTTCSDGGNGGWFRNVASGSNFWSGFYQVLLRRIRQGECSVRPAFISDYLQQYGAQGLVNVGPGAWNTGWHHGKDFIQWAGSPAQRDALTRVHEVSQAVHAARQDAQAFRTASPETFAQLEKAYQHVLCAETSCHFFWGESWVERCRRELDLACESLERAEASY